MENIKICKNCANKVVSNFCSFCGQANHTKRIDAHYIIHDIPHSVFHVDKGLPYTFIQLTTNPGKALLEYLKGKRVKFFKPFAYVIILSTISSLFLKLFTNEISIKQQNNFITILSKYPSLLIFILIPVVSIISWIIIKSKLNYWEHFVIHTYLAAQINVILIIMNLISLVSTLNSIDLVIKLILFNFIFMTYHGYTFSSIITNNYTVKFSLIHLIKISICCFLLGSIYALALSYTGIANIWF